MAREQRYDVDYFPHNCVHGRKMHIIETKYGNDGYAVWFKLLEQLGRSNKHYIDVSDEMNFMYLISVFKVDGEKAASILDDLAKLGAINEFLYKEHRIIFSQKFIESIRDAYRKRKSKIFEYSDILNEKGIKNTQSTVNLPEETHKESVKPTEVIPKEKESKEKESKVEVEKEKEENNTPPPPQNPYDVQIVLLPLKALYDKLHADNDLLFKFASEGMPGKMEAHMFEFCTDLSKVQGVKEKTEQDFRRHFFNWLRKRNSAGSLKPKTLLQDAPKPIDVDKYRISKPLTNEG